MPILLCCTTLVFFVLYAPQPLLMVFANQFDVSPASSGSLMSVTMLPLAIAPICYGLLFTRSNPLTILKYAMLLLATTCIAFAHAPSFQLLLLTRFIQGLILPAALTALTGYIGQQYQGKLLQKNMARYIASSIIGGYLGRMLAANFASFHNWQSFYYFMAIGLIVMSMQINTKQVIHQPPNTASPKAYLLPLKEPKLITLYGMVFCMFFCFSALLNYLPFILTTEFNIIDSKLIGWIYTGYLFGAIISLSAPYLQRRARSDWHLLSFIFLVYCVSISALFITQLTILIVAFTAFCSCMFIIHSTAAPLANQISSAPATVTNGAYVSFYYCGGALGSYLPGLVIQNFGYQVFISTLLIVCLIGLVLSYKNYKQGISTMRG